MFDGISDVTSVPSKRRVKAKDSVHEHRRELKLKDKPERQIKSSNKTRENEISLRFSMVTV